MIGVRIREIRHKKGMTLNELSRLTGVTASYLSQLERDIIEPSLSSLRKIAGALNVPIYSFLVDEQKEHILIRKDERKKLELPGCSITYQFLTPMAFEGGTPAKMEMIYYQLDPLSWSSEDYIRHPAEEIIFIIQGNIEFYLNDEKYLVHEGDSIYIGENIPHRFYNPSTTEKVIGISSISPPVY